MSEPEINPSSTPPELTPTPGATTEPSLVNTGTPPAESKPPEGASAAVVPLTIDDFKGLEGFTPDDPSLKSYVDLMNDPALSAKDRSIKLLELQKQVVSGLSEKSTQAFIKLNEDWVNETKSDPEFAGDKLQPALGNISKLLTRFGDDKVKQAFDYTGAGNHPAIVKFLHNISKVLNEPGADPTKVVPPARARTREEILYPSGDK